MRLTTRHPRARRPPVHVGVRVHGAGMIRVEPGSAHYDAAAIQVHNPTIQNNLHRTAVSNNHNKLISSLTAANDIQLCPTKPSASLTVNHDRNLLEVQNQPLIVQISSQKTTTHWHRVAWWSKEFFLNNDLVTHPLEQKASEVPRGTGPHINCYYE